MGRIAKLSAAVIVFVFCLSLLGPVIVPYHPDTIDLDSIRQPPSLHHPLGTDNKGRDMLARVLHGGKISLSIALVAAALSMGIGLAVGLLSGYFGGRFDVTLMAVVDLVMAFPSLLLAIGISVLFPAGTMSVLVALAAVGWASSARVIRGHVLTLRAAPFIEASRAIGCSHHRILLVHVLPHCVPLAAVLGGLKLGGFILAEAALSFLGLGAQPPTATWGALVSANRMFVGSAPWLVFSPGVMIAVTALCFNLLGDELRDAYERKRTGGSHELPGGSR